MPPIRAVALLAVAVALVTGCTLGDSGIRRGAPITHVQADYGLPDVISDRSGDIIRYYLPTARPAEEWPWDAPRTFYYLDRNLAVTFVEGKAVSAKPISPETRQGTLLRLLRHHGRAE